MRCMATRQLIALGCPLALCQWSIWQTCRDSSVRVPDGERGTLRHCESVVVEERTKATRLESVGDRGGGGPCLLRLVELKRCFFPLRGLRTA
jgi:hypothetical protein